MAQPVAKLVSVNVGLPREIGWRGRTVFTGIWKEPVDGPRTVRHLNVDGDGQGDLNGHGGEQRAVYVYQLDSYRYWQREMQRDDFTFGQFGENFTIDGLGDDEVCVGDRYRIGSALFEVTQPRVTCYRVGIRMDEPRMAALLVEHGRPGFYFRVLEEGEVRAGDDVVNIVTGPEAMTVADINALLYLAGRHDLDQLRRALRIPALSPGWQTSIQALLDEETSDAPRSGNAGLTAAGPPPAWPGFRTLRVTAKHSESTDVVSLELESEDEQPLPGAQPGQFVTLRLRADAGSPPLVRSYSLSGAPGGARYRISVKVEPHGAAGRHIRTAVGVGDRLEVGAPRGVFVLDDGDRPVVLVSAGVGATPMLAMLHALHDAASTREVWWLHGTRNRAEHAFATEAQSLLDDLARAHRRIWYSRPDATDRAGIDFDATGRITPDELAAIGVPSGEFYLCGPTPFMDALRAGLTALEVPASRVHTEIFSAQEPTHARSGRHGLSATTSTRRRGGDRSADLVRPNGTERALERRVREHPRARRSVRRAGAMVVSYRRLSHLRDRSARRDRRVLPEPLEAPADGNLLLCCSRPTVDLAIDL